MLPESGSKEPEPAPNSPGHTADADTTSLLTVAPSEKPGTKHE